MSTQQLIRDDNGEPLPFVDSSWTDRTAAVDNAAATVTRAAETGKCHRVTSIAGSFSAAITGKLLQLIEDTAGAATVKWSGYVTNQFCLSFPFPIKIASGKDVRLTLAASGAGGSLGAVCMTGFTEQG